MEEKVGAVYKAFPQHNGLPFRLFQGLENVAFPPPPKPENGPSGRPFDRKLMILNVLLMHNE